MKILIAIDGSKPAERAVKYAIKLVGALRSPANVITLITVHDDVGLQHARAYVGKEAVADYLREVSEKELKTARKLLDAAGVKHDMVIQTGHVALAIVKFAKAGRFDMIVLGSKGRNAIVDLLLGSVAQRVMATADRPVLVVK
jgi:nucleotide-binding universal stress UspA family protein